jgi:hypothetical protein
MPRPTTAQLAYGSSTVILSTLAMLLLSQTSSGAAIAVIAVSALALGLLVAMTVPLPRPARAGAPAHAREDRIAVTPVQQQLVPDRREAAAAVAASPVPATVAAGAEPVREPAGP